jgi:hypothetical protein
VSFLDTLPAGNTRAETMLRDDLIVGAVTQGLGTYEWWGVESKDAAGNTLVFYMMRDALMIDDVRVNVSATAAQQIADVLEAMLPTSFMTDLAWTQAYQLPPSPQPISETTKAMIQHSKRVDGLVGSHARDLVADVGKYWVLTNKLVGKTLGGVDAAANYGWHFAGDSFGGIRGETATSGVGRVIQGIGTRHDRLFVDYSQVCRLVSLYGTLNGRHAFLGDVLTDARYAHLVSHEGPLRILRQPGVEPIACPLRGLGQDGCPLPAAPGWPAGAPAGRAIDPEGGLLGSSLAGTIGKGLAVIGGGLLLYTLVSRWPVARTA